MINKPVNGVVLIVTVVNVWHLAVRGVRYLLQNHVALYCKGDFQSDGIQALHLDTMLAQSSDLRVARVKDTRFHGKFSSLLEML